MNLRLDRNILITFSHSSTNTARRQYHSHNCVVWFIGDVKTLNVVIFRCKCSLFTVLQWNSIIHAILWNQYNLEKIDVFGFFCLNESELHLKNVTLTGLFLFVCLFFANFYKKRKAVGLLSTLFPIDVDSRPTALPGHSSTVPRSANQYAVLAVWASAKSCREMEMSFPMKLVSRHTKQKVLENLLLHGCVEAGGDKTQRSNTSWLTIAFCASRQQSHPWVLTSSNSCQSLKSWILTYYYNFMFQYFVIWYFLKP